MILQKDFSVVYFSKYDKLSHSLIIENQRIKGLLTKRKEGCRTLDKKATVLWIGHLNVSYFLSDVFCPFAITTPTFFT